ncbi:MAG: GDP-mannose 4,6-dehydratase [Candidatus Omnitrophica bacterium]|nr:GDP-mannose 4,6-dehydratase [Candidatus Omnitrophota bacterium]
MKKVLITGVSGLAGRHLSLRLKRRGFKIFGSYHGPRPDFKISGQFYPVDFSIKNKVYDLVKTVKPNYVFHLAGQSIPQISWKQEFLTMKVNAAGTTHLLNAIRRYAPHAKTLFASSQQVYGKSFLTGKVLKEDDLIFPDNPYAFSKALAELACLDFYHSFGMKVIIARASNHVGPGQSPYFAFSDWCRQIVLAEKGCREPVLEVGDLRVDRDFLSVHDVVRAYELLMFHGKPGQIYNIVSGRQRSMRLYVDYLLSLSKCAMKVKVKTGRLRKNDVKKTLASAMKIRKLGWKPVYSPYDAIRELLNDWRVRLKAHKCRRYRK